MVVKNRDLPCYKIKHHLKQIQVDTRWAQKPVISRLVAPLFSGLKKPVKPQLYMNEDPEHGLLLASWNESSWLMDELLPIFWKYHHKSS